jgi:hypothetical protein
MSHVVRLLCLFVFAYVVGVIFTPSADPISVLMQTAVTLLVAAPAYLWGYRAASERAAVLGASDAPTDGTPR